MANSTRQSFGRLSTTLPQGRQRIVGATTAPSVYNQSITDNTYDAVMSKGFGGQVSSSQNYGANHNQSAFQAGNPVKGLRFVSGFIDFFVMIVLAIVIIVIQGATFLDATTDAEINAKVYGLLFMLIIPGMLYGILMEASPLQGTLGKILTGTVVTDRDGNRLTFMRAVGRNFGKILSGLVPFYIPYLMVLFTKDSQSLHDMMAGTLVFKRGEGPAEFIGKVFA